MIWRPKRDLHREPITLWNDRDWADRPGDRHVFIGLLLHKKLTAARFRLAEQKTREAVEEAEKKGRSPKEGGGDSRPKIIFSKPRPNSRPKPRSVVRKFLNMEKRLLQKEENLEKRIDLFDQKEANLSKREKTILQQEKNVSEMEKKYQNPIGGDSGNLLERIAGISAEEAKESLMKLVESEMRHEIRQAH